jgi:CelD/BcsL family acetyltransferase involved in cellulose biosynthesis
VRVARFIGHGAADRLGPVSEPGHEGAAQALAGSAAELGWSLLLAERLPLETGWPEALPGKRLQWEPSPVVAITGSWDDYLAGRSSNFRSQVRRKERKLLRQHGLEYRLADDPARLDADLDSLYELHRARWGESTSGSFGGARAFHGEFAAAALERGWLRLWLAEVEGRPIAAWYGFRFGGAEWYYQSGRDPAWDHTSVGLVLLAHTLREAIGDGMGEYKLLRGGESYKDRFATGGPGIETVGIAHGAGGRAALAGARSALALPGPARRMVSRRVG